MSTIVEYIDWALVIRGLPQKRLNHFLNRFVIFCHLVMLGIVFEVHDMKAFLYSFSLHSFEIMDQTIVVARGLMGFGDLKGGKEYIKSCGFSTSNLACLSTLLVPHVFVWALIFMMVMLCEDILMAFMMCVIRSLCWWFYCENGCTIWFSSKYTLIQMCLGYFFWCVL